MSATTHERAAVDRAGGGRPAWRAVAMPSEHGGWGLTLEPVLLGLFVAWSVGGVALALAAFVAFVVRTPLKLAAVDIRRRRWLARSRLALGVAAVELLLLGAAVGLAISTAGWRWVLLAVVAVPLVAVELWFDVRSRGRRLVPELCGAVGIAAAAAAIAVAGGRSTRLAIALWLILAGRAVAAIPFVRVQIMRLRRGEAAVGLSDVAQIGGLAIAGLAALVDHRAAAGCAAVVVLAGLQAIWVRRPPIPAKQLGLRQMALGLALVSVTAAGVLL